MNGVTQRKIYTNKILFSEMALKKNQGRVHNFQTKIFAFWRESLVGFFFESLDDEDGIPW